MADREKYYDQVLISSPCGNPPYFSEKGYIQIVFIMVEALAASFCVVADKHDFACFFAAFGATHVACMAFLYGILLLSWKATDLKIIHSETNLDKNKIHPGKQIELHTEMFNPLPWALQVEAIRWNVSPQLEIPESSSELLRIYPHFRKSLRFQAKAKSIGTAAIFGHGVLISDFLGWFNAEVHTETGLEVEVTPDRNLLAEQNSVSGQKFSIEEEPWAIRPYIHGDRLRKILWRGYARRHELNVWVSRPQSPRTFCALVDAGLRARFASPQSPIAPLARIASLIAQRSLEFQSVSIIVYDETRAMTVAQNLAPVDALNAFESWILETLKWKNPKNMDFENDPIWYDAFTHLWRGLKIYKGVDFIKVRRRARFLELNRLISWCRLDSAHPEYMTLSGTELLRRLVQYWYRPLNLDLPDQPSNFDSALHLLRSRLNEDSPSTFAWFSDFADTYSAESLDQASKLLTRPDFSAFAYMVPLTSSLSGSEMRKRTVCRAYNRQVLSGFLNFVGADAPYGAICPI